MWRGRGYVSSPCICVYRYIVRPRFMFVIVVKLGCGGSSGMNTFEEAILEGNREYLREKMETEAIKGKEAVDVSFELNSWRMSLAEFTDRRLALNECNMLRGECPRYQVYYVKYMDNCVSDARFMVGYYESAFFNRRMISRKESALILQEHHDSIGLQEAYAMLAASNAVLRLSLSAGVCEAAIEL